MSITEEVKLINRDHLHRNQANDSSAGSLSDGANNHSEATVQSPHVSFPMFERHFRFFIQMLYGTASN